MLDADFLDHLDPWAKRIEVVEYSDRQFTKPPDVLRGVGLHTPRSERALKELHSKGMG